MPNSSFLSLALCFLVFFHVSLAQIQHPSWGGHHSQHHQQQHRFREQRECRIENLDALEPTRRLESEAGRIEFWDQKNNEQLKCAGVAVTRHSIRSIGLLLPSYSNAPKLIYVVQGSGYQGNLIPGCPETFQSFQPSQRSEEGRSEGERGQDHHHRRFRDQHQRIQRFRQGDILAIPNGIAHWIYNDGDSQLVLVTLHDTSNNNNQLDDRYRKFFLAGNPQTQEGQRGERGERGSSHGSGERGSEEEGTNIFNGFNTQLLSEVFGVDEETARKLQCEDDDRGTIVHVKRGLQLISPPQRWEEEEEQRERQERGANGLEETLCSIRLIENIDDPTRADVYNPHAGRISSLNSQKLPILNYLQLSAERGVLYSNAILAPHWNINAHSVMYVTRGSARVQIVGNRGQRVYDGELREGQVLVVPQGFAVVKQANEEGFEWVSFKTNDNAIASHLAGRTSVLRALPEEVLANAYQIRWEEARRIKHSREEAVLLSPRSGGQGQRVSE
ncbi:11S globulin seed storage protein Ana o 2.0101-like [Telopea speciosissima]|uniref:11S globulin seed storage protein Ana o 2.0101-like n=1 Tax=Telopea speciosissima TaxID=54955 RepID=UPI001CC5BF85|nr:11S globulin seed storage protein Ana o 2.0101-like [Telopea speciosissima]